MAQARPATAVVDIGKTNAKLVLVDERGEAFEIRTTPNRVVDAPPYPHHDVDALWRWLLQALAALVREGHAIEAITITAHGAAGMFVRPDGGLAVPMIDYEFAGPGELEEYDRIRPPFSETASPLLPGGLNVGRQVYYTQQRFPREFAQADSFLFNAQYWSARFSGVRATEFTSLGAHTDLWEPARARLSSLVRAQGWERLFPPMRRADDVLGPITREVVEATGLPAGCPVYCGIHDSNASLLNYLRAGDPPPFSVVSSGTWVILMAPGCDTVLDPSRDMLMNVDIDGRPVPSARFMGGREFQLLTTTPAGGHPVSLRPADIDAAVAAGAMFLPGFVPGTGPYPEAQGRLHGAQPASLDDTARTALATLYVALMTDVCLGMLRSRGPIWVEGSLAHSPQFLRVLATLRGEPVRGSSDATGATRGAWLLTRRQAPAPVVPATASPDVALAPALHAYREAWRKIVAGA